MKKKAMLVITAVLTMSLIGCGQSTAGNSGTEAAAGGVLLLRINPEIAVEYDEKGTVTGVTARNDDALDIIAECQESGLIGRQTRDVMTDLVTAIGEAGYFVEEIEGEKRQIIIEIESGSELPHDAFLDEVVSDVRDCVNSNDWQSPVDVLGESDYGMTDYNDTDYGPNNDGVTDYDDTDYGPNNDGVTDYNDTDYGPNNDGVTDYNDTDYGPNNDGVTDYNDTDYGPNNDGVTDYNDTDYGPNNDGVTDYDDGSSNYDGNSNYGSRSNYGDSSYDSNSNYGDSNYDSGSDYGNSDYDD